MNQTMLRQVSSRNNRSKGLKVKKALQIFFILALTIWLLYQIKHSYNKKKSYDKNSKPVSISSLKEELITNNTPQEEIIKFGRKELPQKEEKRQVKISERDTNIDENYEDEETAEIAEQEAAVEAEETEELEKDEMGADSEESTLLEDEESGKDEISEARERSFHGDNVASAVTHYVNLTNWHDDYLDNINKNKEINSSSISLTNGTNLVRKNGAKNKTENETGLVSELMEKTKLVNLTNGIVVGLNESIVNTNSLGLNLDEKEKNNLNVVSDDSNGSINTTSVSSSPVKNEDEKRNESHIENMGVNGGDVVLE